MNSRTKELIGDPNLLTDEEVDILIAKLEEHEVNIKTVQEWADERKASEASRTQNKANYA